MIAKRVGAVVLAVAFVVGALLVRRNVIEGSDDDSGNTPTTTPSAAAAAVVCATELQAACDAVAEAEPGLDVLVEPAGVTLDRLAELSDDADAPIWLTISPFPAMVDELRSASSLSPLGATAEPLAASQLSVATPAGGRSDVLAAACADAPLWRCLGERAGDPWTDLDGDPAWTTVRPSLGVVEREAVALASFANAVTEYFGSQQMSLDEPAFIAWLRRLAGAVDESQLSAGTPLGTMSVRPSLDVAATTEAERAALGGDRFGVNYPDPTMWVEAVLAVPDGTSVPEGISSTAAAALAASGWESPADVGQPVPGASTMLALRALWGQL